MQTLNTRTADVKKLAILFQDVSTCFLMFHNVSKKGRLSISTYLKFIRGTNKVQIYGKYKPSETQVINKCEVEAID